MILYKLDYNTFIPRQYATIPTIPTAIGTMV